MLSGNSVLRGLVYKEILGKELRDFMICRISYVIDGIMSCTQDT